MTVPRPNYRLRRLVTVVAAVLVLGVAVHGACQAIEHHEGAKDAIALCAAAVALFAGLRLAGAGRGARHSVPAAWAVLCELIPGGPVAVATRRSPVWLQRFRN